MDDVASGAEYGAVSRTDAGIASGFVDVIASDAVPDIICGFVDAIAFGADGGASAAEPDTIPGATLGPFSSAPGIQAFSKFFDSVSSSAPGTVAAVVE